jgi:hypothetical protein
MTPLLPIFCITNITRQFGKKNTSIFSPKQQSERHDNNSVIINNYGQKIYLWKSSKKYTTSRIYATDKTNVFSS